MIAMGRDAAARFFTTCWPCFQWSLAFSERPSVPWLHRHIIIIIITIIILGWNGCHECMNIFFFFAFSTNAADCCVLEIVDASDTTQTYQTSGQICVRRTSEVEDIDSFIPHQTHTHTLPNAHWHRYIHITRQMNDEERKTKKKYQKSIRFSV